MKKNLLSNYIFDLLKSIEQNLSIYIQDKEPECIHRLRVDIKKIKAVFDFIENLYEEKYNTAKLKPLFKRAGKIRETQINIHFLSLFPNPPDNLIEKLKKKENSLTEQFIKSGTQYVKLLNNFRKHVYLPEKPPSINAINKYFEKEKLKANKKLKTKNREDVHSYRAKIKKLMYVYNALPKRIQKEIELNEAKINRQQKKLGDWHDTYSTITFLSNKHFSKKTAEYVLKFKEKEERQFNALLSNLINNQL